MSDIDKKVQTTNILKGFLKKVYELDKSGKITDCKAYIILDNNLQPMFIGENKNGLIKDGNGATKVFKFLSIIGLLVSQFAPNIKKELIELLNKCKDDFSIDIENLRIRITTDTEDMKTINIDVLDSERVKKRIDIDYIFPD